jgi:hypothetical protein
MFKIVNRQDVTNTFLLASALFLFHFHIILILYLFSFDIRTYFAVICGSIRWRILAQFGLALHSIFNGKFPFSNHNFQLRLGPHGILLTDSLRSRDVTFSLSHCSLANLGTM